MKESIDKDLENIIDKYFTESIRGDFFGLPREVDLSDFYQIKHFIMEFKYLIKCHREIICRKCGIREQLGITDQVNF